MPVFLLRYLPHLIGAAVLCALTYGAYKWAYNRGHEAAVAVCELDKAAAYSAQQAAYRAAQEAVQASYAKALAVVRVGQDKAARDARDWRRRYEDAISRDPGCATWAAQPVGCPTK